MDCVLDVCFFSSWFLAMKIILIFVCLFVCLLACLNYDEIHFRLKFSVDYTPTKKVNSGSNSIHHAVGSQQNTQWEYIVSKHI